MTSFVTPSQGKPTTAEAGGSFPLRGLLVLSAAIFTSMATEFLPGGLIPQISGDFGRSVSEVGNLITVFALTVILTAAPLAIVTRRIPRKLMVLVSFSVIGVANIATVLSPTFEMLIAGRVLGAIAHGAFWSVVAAYPAHLVRPSQLGKATAITAAGGSVSGVLGLPLGNAIGQAFGWRVSFAALAGLVLVVLLLMIWLLPSAPALVRKTRTEEATPVLRDGTLPGVLMVCLLILLVVAAQNGFGTYSVVWLLDAAYIAPAGIPIILLVSGIASAVGVAVVGALYGRFPTRLFLGALAAMIGILCTVPLAATSGPEPVVWILMCLMGAVFGGIPVMLQTRMMWTASPPLRNVAAALQTTAFNVGIGGGAFLGGLVLEKTSLQSLPYWAATAMGLALLVAVSWQVRRHRTRHVTSCIAIDGEVAAETHCELDAVLLAKQKE
jgi:MFS transporter, DHA1 family, inner membrane transport protein